MGIEEEFDIEIPDEDAEKLTSVGEALNYTLGKIEIHRDISLGLEPAAWGWLPPAMDLDGENFRKQA